MWRRAGPLLAKGAGATNTLPEAGTTCRERYPHLLPAAPGRRKQLGQTQDFIHTLSEVDVFPTNLM